PRSCCRRPRSPSPRRRGARSGGRVGAPRRSDRASSCVRSLGMGTPVEEEEAAARLGRDVGERVAEELEDPGKPPGPQPLDPRLAALARVLPGDTGRVLEAAEL